MKGFVGIGTFEKNIGTSKSVKELKGERKEKYVKDVTTKYNAFKKATTYSRAGAKTKLDLGIGKLGKR